MALQVGPEPRGSRLVFYLTTGLFLVFGFLYTAFRVVPPIGYFHAGNVFTFTPGLLVQSATHAGGLTGLLAAFLHHLDLFTFGGAVTFVVMSGAIICGTNLLSERSVSVGREFLVLPGIVMLWLRQSPDAEFHWAALASLLSLGACIFFAGLSVNIFSNGPAAKLPQSRTAGSYLWVAAAWITSLGVFWVAGFWAQIAFSILVLAVGSRVVGHSRLRVMVAVPPVIPMVLLSTPKPINRVAAGFDLPHPVLPHIIALFSSALVVCGAIYASRLKRRVLSSSDRGWKRGFDFVTAVGVAAQLAALTAVILTFDRPGHDQAAIDFFSNTGQHARVLQLCRRPGVLDPASEIRLHLALFREGRLGDDLFTYQNQGLWSVFPGLGGGVHSCRPQGRTLFELGQVGAAEHFMHEALEWEGNRPDVLRILAQINLLKSRPRAARVFLNNLDRVPFLEHIFASCGKVCQDEELESIRSLLPTGDIVHDELPCDAILRQSLRANPTNRMAFEYLMAHYLLARDLTGFAANLSCLDTFNTQGLPRHYEEAVLLIQKMQGKAFDLRNYRINPETVNRFNAFLAALNRNEHKTDEGRVRLEQQYGSTYWLYYFCPPTSVEPAQPTRAVS